MHNLPTGPRRRLSSIINTKLKEIAHFAEAEINAVVTNKKIIDELRHYTEPYEATLLSYETEPKTLENLRRAIDSNWAISHKFYRLKAKMMKLKSFAYADRNAKISKVNKKIEFKQAVEIVKKAFAKVDPEYADIFASFLNQGQVDVFAKKGKRGGAYCSSYETLPIFILLNHLADFNSVSTLAHETGHALHSHFSTKTQRPLYRDYTTATAEVASTLFENFVFDEVFPTLSKKEQVAALHDKINSSVQTIFRQMACFNFELELHNQIRAQGSLSKEKIAGLMNKHMQSYLGPLFKLTEDDGYFFVQWGHIRRFFYVYSYAFGELISNALYEKYKADKGFATQIKKFLSLGGSASPEEIFASIGLDIRQPNFFELGLKKIEADIDQLEKLLK
jgi:oligoendopeptidase F